MKNYLNPHNFTNIDHSSYMFLNLNSKQQNVSDDFKTQLNMVS